MLQFVAGLEGEKRPKSASVGWGGSSKAYMRRHMRNNREIGVKVRRKYESDGHQSGGNSEKETHRMSYGQQNWIVHSIHSAIRVTEWLPSNPTEMHILEVNTLNHFEDSIQYPSDISMPPTILSKQNNANPYSAFIPASYGVIDICREWILKGIIQVLSRIMSSRRKRGKFVKIAQKWDKYWMELGYISHIVNFE
ncbi:hypothetical protein CDAR_391301 [Caerostris darwini]|uniref:Uncharacterized protein n=1 Tax=Caerostris darwini TaxID=1538125 RepID=A0AAV4R594_9ARAC|nr:hypothetical protein CDAR_391301 [Caerostris darwini]